jgi:hypothetical protein
MAKKKMKKHRKKYRNAGATPASAPPRRTYRPRRGPAPDMSMTFASAAGGGGGALLGGFLANRGWDPEMVALAMTVGGGVGAYTLDGPWRIAANGLAAAGAGQLALSVMAEREAKKVDKDKDAGAKPKKPSNASFSGLDRAFNRVRERVQGVYEDDEEDRFIDDAA